MISFPATFILTFICVGNYSSVHYENICLLSCMVLISDSILKACILFTKLCDAGIGMPILVHLSQSWRTVAKLLPGTVPFPAKLQQLFSE